MIFCVLIFFAFVVIIAVRSVVHHVAIIAYANVHVSWMFVILVIGHRFNIIVVFFFIGGGFSINGSVFSFIGYGGAFGGGYGVIGGSTVGGGRGFGRIYDVCHVIGSGLDMTRDVFDCINFAEICVVVYTAMDSVGIDGVVASPGIVFDILGATAFLFLSLDRLC